MMEDKKQLPEILRVALALDGCYLGIIVSLLVQSLMANQGLVLFVLGLFVVVFGAPLVIFNLFLTIKYRKSKLAVITGLFCFILFVCIGFLVVWSCFQDWDFGMGP